MSKFAIELLNVDLYQNVFLFLYYYELLVN